MTLLEKLQNQIKELSEKCEVFRNRIKKTKSVDAKDLADLFNHKDQYLIADIRLDNVQEDGTLTFVINWQDEKSLSLSVRASNFVFF